MSLQVPCRPGVNHTVSDSDIPTRRSPSEFLDVPVPTRPPNTRQVEDPTIPLLQSTYLANIAQSSHRNSGAATPYNIPTSTEYVLSFSPRRLPVWLSSRNVADIFAVAHAISALLLLTGNSIPGAQVTEILAGQTLKSFYAHGDLLKSRSRHFRDLFAGGKPANSSPAPLRYPEIDEFAMALFIRWLYGAMLNGPSDFHSMQHYLALYVLADRFQIERLANEIMDMVRMYYRTSNMTAPPYRLEYIYTETLSPNEMRRFMTCTAAYRALCEGSISDGIREVLGKISELSPDFAQALIECHKSGLMDVRRGKDCDWHVHRETAKCKVRGVEPWQNV